jgi:glycosyltransferase involved in cell wall biosynthesis
MISFIIPTKNEERAIEKTIRSVARYSGSHEVIISDAGSTDRTGEIARELGTHVLVYNGTARQNISQGRNVGAAAAKGEFVVFLDADVTIPDMDGFFRSALSKFENDPKLVALTTCCRVSSENQNFMDWLMFGVIVPFLFYIQNNVFGTGAAAGEFQMIRRDVFANLGGFDETLVVTEDMELFWRLAKIGRTRFYGSLRAYHSGRRAHAIGWTRLIWQWVSNWFSALFFRKSIAEEWVEIR